MLEATLQYVKADQRKHPDNEDIEYDEDDTFNKGEEDFPVIMLSLC